MQAKPLSRGQLKSGDAKLQRRREIAANIRRLREEKDWSQTTLALQVGCSARVIARIESAETALYFHLLDEIAAALGVGPDQIVPKEPLPVSRNEKPAAETRKRPPPSLPGAGQAKKAATPPVAAGKPKPRPAAPAARKRSGAVF